VEFKVLGHVELVHQTTSLPLKRSKVGQMLSLLIARINETVSVDTLIDELWGTRIPRSAHTTLQTYVYHARKMFADRLACPDDQPVLLTRPRGYAIVAAEDAIDAAVFKSLVDEGTQHLDNADPESAAASLSQALKLCRGPAFSGMPIGPILQGHVTYLDEFRLTAVGLWMDAHSQLGHHRELIPELRSIVTQNPLNESFHALLIGALYKCGRRAEALQAYQRLWHILDSELGVQPGLEIQRLHSTVLC
jgi:SARP family transcriptional regulator, regulator of embCAB operon